MPSSPAVRTAVRHLLAVAPAALLAAVATAQTPSAPAPPRLDALPAAAAPVAGTPAPGVPLAPVVAAPERPCAVIAAPADAPARRATAVPAAPTRIVERLDDGGAADGGLPAQAVECRVTVEADGTRIEELRVGGQTRRVVVHPKDGNRPYEIQLLDAGRDAAAKSGPGRGGAGQRVWPVLSF